MSKAFRPTVEQWELFCDVRDAVLSHKKQVKEAQSYLDRVYSIDTLNARKRNEHDRMVGGMLKAQGMSTAEARQSAREMRLPPEGWKKARSSPKNATYRRLMQFVRDRADLDLSSEPEGISKTWAWRVLYVAFLMTDPDAGERGLPSDALLATPWDERGMLGRWWARESAFEASAFAHWPEMIRMALAVVSRSVPKGAGSREWFGTAVFLARDHPEWSDSKIATHVGVNASTLSRSAEYQRAAIVARTAKSNLKRGHIETNDESGQREVVAEFEAQYEADEAFEEESE